MPSHMELLPGLPEDVAVECLIRIPFQKFSTAASVCKGWKAEINLPEFWRRRKSAGLARSIIITTQARVEPTHNTREAKLSMPVYRLTVCEPEAGCWSELPPPPGFSAGLPVFCQVVGVSMSLVVVGGYHPESWEVLNSVFVYDFLSAKWRRGADMPGGSRSFFGCASDFDGTLYVVGGHDNEKNALRSTMAYDVAKDDWVHLPDMAVERDECKGIFHGGTFHVIGGYRTDTQGDFMRNAEQFDVEKWRWVQVEEDFLETATCPKMFTNRHGERVYMCREGNLVVLDDASWQVLAGFPDDMASVAFIAEWQGKLLVFASAKFGEPYKAHVMNLKTCCWTNLETPEEYSGHVQSGFCLEI